MERNTGSAEFVVPEAVSIPEARDRYPRHHQHYPHSSARPHSSSRSHGSAIRFADSQRYSQRHVDRVNALTDRFAPSALFLARKADPAPYVPLTVSAIQTHVQPADYGLRPPAHHSQQAVLDFYRACRGRYGVSVNFEKTTTQSSGGASGVADSATVGGGGGGASSGFVLLTLGSHAKGGRGLGSHKGAASSASRGGGAPVSSLVGADQNVEDFRIAQLRRNIKHVDTQLCMFFNTKEGCRRGEQCEFLHVKQ